VYRGSDKKDVAVDVINFLTNDLAAGKILGTERGLPVNLDVRTAVESSVTDKSMKTSIDVENTLGKSFGPSPQVPLKGHSTVRSELIKAAESVQAGKATSAQAAEAFITASKAAISK
jgi:multiple sugar transport system substrate-binding protein